MPGVEFLGAVTMDESPLLGSLKVGTLKTHKALPRVETRHMDLSERRQKDQRPEQSLPSRARDRRFGAQSDRLRSWIQDSSDKRTVPVADRPVTPPIDFRDNFKSWIDDKALKDREFLSQQRIDPGNSPLVVAASPPISDISRVMTSAKHPRGDPLSNARKVSGGSAGTFPESRTDSFRTARENLSSDDESFSLDSPSLHPARQKWLRDTAFSHSKDVGLGLLQVDDDESSTPKEMIHQTKPEASEGNFVAFDGTWKPHALQDLEDADSEVTARRDSEEKNKVQELVHKERAKSDSPTLGVEARRPPQKAPRGQRQKKSIQDPSEKRRAGRGMRSPLPSKGEARPGDSLYSEFQDMDDIDEKRLSQASTSSTVVAAVVIESSPPFRRPSLRHTGKLLMLDDLDDYHRHSDHTCTQSEDSFAKHTLRSSKNADQRLRESFASQSMSSKTSKPTLAKQERSTVVVVPDRRSSLQSSTNSSKRFSRTFSLNSKPQSSRPTTAPENALGDFDGLQRGRTFSVVIQQATPVKNVERDPSPPEPTNGSLPVVDAMKELTRTTSVTSRGMTTHYIPQMPTSPGTNTMQTADACENQTIKADRSSSGDWSALRPTSALVTPYSLRSHSSTPGTLEVNEATAISIFPHTNESILVISKFAGGDVSSPKEQSAVIAGNASIGLQSNFTPFISQPFTTNTASEILDSSLQNPREPPSPPGFKVIPPTPANAASSSEDTVRHVHSSKRSKRLSAPFAALRRAMSASRYTESSIANPFIFTRTLSLRDTAHHRQPRSPEDSKDNQLHPFWRPRTYRDGAGESDSDIEDVNRDVLSPWNPRSDRTTRSTKKADMIISNPKRTVSLRRRFTDSLRSELKLSRRASTSVTSDVLPGHSSHGQVTNGNDSSSPKRTQSLTRRIGGSLHLSPASASRHRRPRRSTTADWNNQPDYEFVPVGQRQFAVDETGQQARNSGFQNLAERIERRRSLREESKREERRKMLKGRIKPVGARDFKVPDEVYMAQPSTPQRSLRRYPATESWTEGQENHD